MSLTEQCDRVECPPLPPAERAEDRERWYVAMTQPGRELIAMQNLANQNFHAFLPRTPTTYRVGRRFATRLTPLFPQYVFVLMDPAKQRWRSVNGTLGVRRLITGSDGPQAVRAGLVEALMASCDCQEILKLQPDAFKPGDSVKVVSGPFAGIVGTLLGLSPSGRVKLLLEIMNGKVTVNSDAGSIVSAP